MPLSSNPLCANPASWLLLKVKLIEKAIATPLVKALAGIDKAYLNIKPNRGRYL